MKKILVVEDEATLSSMYKTKFEREKYNVVVLHDGSAVLETARKEKPNHFMASESLVFDNNTQNITIRGSKTQPTRFNQMQCLWLKYNLATGAIQGESSNGQSIITR